MKQRVKTIIKAALLVLVAVWVIDKMPFNKKIDQQIAASLYENNTITGQTTVVMKGEKSRYLFRKREQYWGKFQIMSYEKTTREKMGASISWKDDDPMQTLLYTSSGVFPDMDIMYYLLINEEMTKFALMFGDGTVLATSDELYRLYTKHFSINSAGGMSVDDVGGIPKIQ